jgi:putative ABC transport system permease protein
MDVIRQDLVFTLRLLRRDRAYTAAAILTLGLCVGANAAIFTVVRSVLLRPLPYPESDRLVFTYDSFPGAGVERAGTSIPNHLDREKLTGVFDSVALYQSQGLDAGEAEGAERLDALQVTPSFFRVLRAGAARGRVLTDADAVEGKANVAVISHAYWQRQLAGTEDVLNHRLRLDGTPYTIVGVMPPGFSFLDPAVSLWIPATFSADDRSEDSRYSQNYQAIARLAPGVTASRTQAELAALNAGYIERAGPLKGALVNAGYHTVVVPLAADLVRNVWGALRLLWGGVLFVLLIAAVNITNLALVRAAGRLKELATRHAVGAARSRVARQLLTESVVLTAAGSAVGLALAWGSLGGMSRMGLDELPRGHEIRMDGIVVALTLGLTLVLGLAIGAVPAVQFARMDLSLALRDDSRSSTSGRGARLTRRTLVVAQVALAFVLLVGAGLLFASFERLLRVDPGFRSEHVLTGQMNPPGSRYRDDNALRNFAERVLTRVRSLPGLDAAGLTGALPFTGSDSSSVIIPDGYQMAPGESVVAPRQLRATPGYFDAMRIPLVRGRFFSDSDRVDAPRVVIVDETLARKFWPNADPVGKRMYLPQRPEDVVKPGPGVIWLHVVGVVGSVKLSGLIEGEGARVGAYYFPYAQDPVRGLGLAVRTSGDPTALTSAVRQALVELDPQLAFFDVLAMPERVERSLDRRRTPMLLSVSFSVIALLLAAVGLYGVLAYQVSQRTREIGIRMALGSEPIRIARLVLKEGTTLVTVGLAGGLAGAFALRGAIASELYAVDALDPLILSAVAFMLALTSILACLGPARRAAHVNPVVALSQQ